MYILHLFLGDRILVMGVLMEDNTLIGLSCGEYRDTVLKETMVPDGCGMHLAFGEADYSQDSYTETLSQKAEKGWEVLPPLYESGRWLE